ncbi:MAG: hypothetical protein KDD62_15310, partial [Bdellovibrionales bacterium]|nr:hypothetical protein [Bdellovibrionales bacterium]
NLDKQTLFALAEMVEGIPEGIRTRPPTAELMTGQTDMDVLPADYDVMSPLIRQVITPYRTRAELIRMFSKQLGERVEEVIDTTIRRIRGSASGFGKEWAHRQLPPAFRVTEDAVGAGRRVPYDSQFGE